MMTKEHALSLFATHSGLLTVSEAMKLGIHCRTVYALHKAGKLEKLSRGLYCLTKNTSLLSHIDLVTVVKHLPKAVICLTSALSFHGLTTQIPHEVHIAYQQGWWQPTLSFPPIKLFRYAKNCYDIGIEYNLIDGIKIPIYTPEKTIVDCFKFRYKIGIDIAIEALKEYWKTNTTSSIHDIMEFAKISRVEKVITPYVEAIIHE
jgi:predicted transcriptional regulator of viral defense system